MSPHEQPFMHSMTNGMRASALINQAGAHALHTHLTARVNPMIFLEEIRSATSLRLSEARINIAT